MRAPISIEKSSKQSFDIATYTQFNIEMKRILDDYAGNLEQEVKITPDFMQKWQEKIDVLVDVNKVIRATVNTEKLAEIDQLRGKAIMRLFDGIKYQLTSFNQHELDAAKRLDIIRKKYRGIQHMNYDRETALVEGLLIDLSSSEAKQDLETLKYSHIFTKIGQYNEEFRKLYGEVSQKRSKISLPTFAQLRTEMNPIWDIISRYIEAGYLFAENETDEKNLATLIKEINQRIKQIKDNFNRSAGLKKANQKKNAEASVVEEEITN